MNIVKREVQFGAPSGASAFVEKRMSLDWVGAGGPLGLAGGALPTRVASPSFLLGLLPILPSLPPSLPPATTLPL